MWNNSFRCTQPSTNPYVHVKDGSALEDFNSCAYTALNWFLIWVGLEGKKCKVKSIVLNWMDMLESLGGEHWISRKKLSTVLVYSYSHYTLSEEKASQVRSDMGFL